MKKKLFLLLGLLLCLPMGAQSTQSEQTPLSHRDSVLREARHLKNIFRTEEAIGLLMGLRNQEVKEEEKLLDEELMTELADCHFQRGAYEDAVGVYYVLSTKNPEKVLYKIRMMQIFYRLKAYAQCVEAGRAVLALDSIPAVISYVGDAYQQMEEADSALWYYRQALAYNRKNEAVISKVFNILIGKEDYDGAIAVTEPLLADDPDNKTIAPLKGLAHFRKGDYNPACDIFERQKEIGNTSYPIRYYLGQSYWHIALSRRAEKELIAAWQMDSSDVNLAYAIAAVRADIGRPFERDIKPWLDKAWKMVQPDSLLLSRLEQQYGMNSFRKGDAWEEAIEHYQEAYRYNPKFTSALSTIGYCYEQMEDYKNALLWYEKYLAAAKADAKGRTLVTERITVIKSELFMTE